MADPFDVAPDELIAKVAEEFKNKPEFTPPTWSVYVKTGMHKQNPPMLDSWWYFRCAAIFRSVAKLGPVGVAKLRTKYGGKKNRGYKPERFYKGSGSIIRKSLQQLEKAGFVRQTQKGCHKGRIVTPEGKSFLDKIAASIIKSKPQRVPYAKQPAEPAVISVEKSKESKDNTIVAEKSSKSTTVNKINKANTAVKSSI